MEPIKKRIDFKEYDPVKVSHVEYEPYEEIPKSTDFVAGEKRKMIVRNKETGGLEEIEYILHGAIPLPDFYSDVKYMEYWGRIIPECGMEFDFSFDLHGKLKKICAIYAAPDVDPKKIKWGDCPGVFEIIADENS